MCIVKNYSTFLMQTLHFHRQQVQTHYSHIPIILRQKSHIKHKLKGIVNLENTIFKNISGVLLERVHIH